MQNTQRTGWTQISVGDVVAGGVPVVIWGISGPIAETVTLIDTDGAGSPGSNTIATLTLTLAAQTIDFPYGIQMKNGASVSNQASTVTVFYTKI